MAVLVVGDGRAHEDCTTGESRDVASLSLPGVQEQLVLAVAATGTPVVLVLVAGRPIGSPAVHAAAAAVLMAWLPGEAGAGGDRRRAGRLWSTPAASSRSATHAARGKSRCSTATRCPAAGRTGMANTSTCRRFVLSSDVHVPAWKTLPRSRRHARATTHVSVAVSQHRHRTRDEVVRSTAAIRWLGDPSGARVAGLRSRVARPRRAGDRHFEIAVADLGFTSGTGRYVVEAGEIHVFAGRPPQTSRLQGR